MCSSDLALNPLKEVVADVAADILKDLNDIMAFYRTELQPAVVTVAQVGRAQIKLMTGHATEALEVMRGIPDKIAKAQQQNTLGGKFVQEIFKNSLDSIKDFNGRDREDIAPNGFLGIT